MDTEPIRLELLAPARDAETAIAAIDHGADAVYIGGPDHGARAAAANSVEDISRVADYAHRFGARVYVTLNTLIYDDELDAVQGLVTELYAAGVDALIVQDMALLEMDLPPVELHASTQCDARTPEKVSRLAEAGFSQIVLPREFSLEDIRRAAQAVPGVPMEVFVHGALCVSYSGDCQAGQVLGRRSANRGECPQICRLEFRLTDAQGRTITPPDGGRPTRHWLSLADMNRLDSLASLAEAGARSFKIEGRLKGAAYVKEVTAAYSAALDALVAGSEGRYVRASYGRTALSFRPDVRRCFNRGFTRYCLRPGDERGISSTLTPKFIGPQVAVMRGADARALHVDTQAKIAAGDGLVWFDSEGRLHGFRVNRAEEDKIYPAPGADLPSKTGTPLYRNHDHAHEALMTRADTARRTLGLKAVLQVREGHIALSLTDCAGRTATVTSPEKYTDTARQDPRPHRREILSRLGDTFFSLDALDDRAGDLFIPAKTLTALRRQALEALEAVPLPRTTRPHAAGNPDLHGLRLTYHDNVANRLAEKYYTEHGAEVAEKALEIEPPKGEVRVMTTRYCLRREQGACLKIASQRDRLPVGDLFLEAPAGRLRLRCDCAECQMQIFTKP